MIIMHISVSKETKNAPVTDAMVFSQILTGGRCLLLT